MIPAIYEKPKLALGARLVKEQLMWTGDELGKEALSEVFLLLNEIITTPDERVIIQTTREP